MGLLAYQLNNQKDSVVSELKFLCGLLVRTFFSNSHTLSTTVYSFSYWPGQHMLTGQLQPSSTDQLFPGKFSIGP